MLSCNCIHWNCTKTATLSCEFRRRSGLKLIVFHVCSIPTSSLIVPPMLPHLLIRCLCSVASWGGVQKVCPTHCTTSEIRSHAIVQQIFQLSFPHSNRSLLVSADVYYPRPKVGFNPFVEKSGNRLRNRQSPDEIAQNSCWHWTLVLVFTSQWDWFQMEEDRP